MAAEEWLLLSYSHEERDQLSCPRHLPQAPRAGAAAGDCQGAAETLDGWGQRTDLCAGKEHEAPVMGLRLLCIFTCHPHTQGRAGFLQTHGAIPTNERPLGACTLDIARSFGWWPVLQLCSTFQPPLQATSVQASKGKTLYHLSVFRL